MTSPPPHALNDLPLSEAGLFRPWWLSSLMRWAHAPQQRFLHRKVLGFTLAELLIALAILGVIATFTIPKIISSQQSSQQLANAKDVMASISGAYLQYSNSVGGAVPTTMTMDNLMPYLNYVKRDTSGLTLDDHPGFNGMYTCSAGVGVTCVTLHNGMTVFWNNTYTMGGAGTTNAIYFLLDPDSVRGTSGNADAPGKSVCFMLYSNGRITSRANTLPNTVVTLGTIGPNATLDPSWFSW